MKQDVQEVISGLPEAARVLVLAEVQKWQAFAGDPMRVDEQPASDSLKFVVYFDYGSVGTVITPSSA